MQKNMDIGGAPYVPWGTPRDMIPSRYRRKNIWKRLLSGALTAVMLAGLLPAAAALATENSEGLCPHHQEHTETCGYLAPLEGVPCGHIHEAGCYSGGVLPAEGEEAAADACAHTHDETCGYSPATAGTPCGFVCPICPVQALIDVLPTADELAAMSQEERETAHTELLAADEAYNALTDEQKAEVTGAEIFESLFDVFNDMVNTLSDHQHPVCGGDENCTDPDHTDGHSNVEWTAWENTNAMPTDADSYYLTADVTLSATWTVPTGETQLCLNGHSITYSNDQTPGSVIKVPEEATLTITDCAQYPGQITGGTGIYYQVYDGYTIDLDDYYGGGIVIDEGTLNFYGGSITKNDVTFNTANPDGYGGGVFNKGGTFNMYGGTITENITTGEGSAVLCYGGEFNLYGGTIANNEMKEQRHGWGAVSLSGNADMTMTGGEISDNTGGYYTIGVMVEKSEFTISDSALIKGHEIGVYCRDEASFSMNGGKVTSTGNSVFLTDHPTMTMTAGEISSSGGHGIYMSLWSEPLTVSGGKITGANNSSSYGICIDRANDKNMILLSGNPEISSIYLPCLYVGSPVQETSESLKIEVTGELTYTTPIPITMKEPGQFTSGWSEKTGDSAENFSAYFTSKNSTDYELKKAEDGELYLAPLSAEHLHDGTAYDKKLSGLQSGRDGAYAITESGNYYLTNDYAVNSSAIDHTLYIGDGTKKVTVNLCLNGHNLSTASGPVIIVRENATLNLYDCKDAGKITGGTGRTAEKDGKTYSYGGGVMVYGTLNMHGGSITGNSANAVGVASGFGGGVYVVSGGEFNLYGGSIAGNTAKTTGGGVTVAGANDAAPVSEPIKIPLEGGSSIIKDWNTGTIESGSAELQSLSRTVRALRSGSAAEFNLYGGSITNNTAQTAGGVNVRGKVTVESDSAITVTGNTANSELSNLYFPTTNAYLTVNGIPADNSTLGVRMETPDQFAVMGTDVDEKEAQPFFSSDDTTYGVLTMTNGLKLADKYDTPNISFNYDDEILTGFEAGGSYTINGTQVTLAEDSTLPIKEEWLGASIFIVRTGSITSSDAQELSIPNRPNAPTAPGINYEGEALTDVAENMQYSTDGESWSDCPQDKTLSAFNWTGQQMTLYFRAKATSSAFASKYVEVTIPARPSAPAVQGVNETVKGRKDGRITGLTAGAAYEISSDDGKLWSDAVLTGTEITGLTPGAYQVRAKASNSSFKSAAATVQIAVGDDPTYTLNVTAPAFDAVYTGYAQPEAKAITISSSGNSDAAISSVSLGGENKEAFVLNKTDGVTIAAGSTDDATYTVRPAVGLSQGTYTAIITVAYHDHMTAEAQVTFTVNRHSGGGGGDPTFPPTIKPGEGGEVTVKPRNPEKGDKVTITPKPEKGYEVDEVIVTDRDGDQVTVTDNGDGTWSFIQPSGKVTIEVTFREIGPEPMPFTDVPPDAWYIDGVRYVYTHHIMSGTSPTTFSPSTPVSRGMIVQILYNLAGQPEVEGGHNFSDVPAGYWSEKAIIWAVQNGVVSGYGDGTFGPDDTLTREQLAVVLFNYANAMGYDTTARRELSGFDDVTQAQSWSRTALEWAYAEHLITGTSGTSMSPTGQSSRAQIAVIMMRFCERYVESE